MELQKISIPWHDENIPPGNKWFDEIKENVNQAKAAVFLVTAHSLTSYFILQEEILKLLEKNDKKEMLLIALLAEHCNWKSVEWLRKILMLPRDMKPIARLSTAKQDEIL